MKNTKMTTIFVNDHTSMRVKFEKYSPYFAVGGRFTADGVEYLVRDITVDIFNLWTRIYFLPVLA
jgi:hypothetical protein